MSSEVQEHPEEKSFFRTSEAIFFSFLQLEPHQSDMCVAVLCMSTLSSVPVSTGLLVSHVCLRVNSVLKGHRKDTIDKYMTDGLWVIAYSVQPFNLHNLCCKYVNSETLRSHLVSMQLKTSFQ